MTLEDIKKFLESESLLVKLNLNHVKPFVEHNNKLIYKYVRTKCNFIKNFSELIYLIKNKNNLENLHIFCKCGNKNKFINSTRGYSKYCSTKCAANSILTKQNRINTYIIKYGDASYVNVEKRKETCLKKYGKENYFETEEFKKKARKTKEIKYGDSNFTNNEKRKETCKQRYGGNSCMSSEIVKQKHNETMLERYNVKSYSMTEDWYTKTKITSLKKYGKVHYTKTDEYKNKFKDQNFVKKMIKKQKLTKINNGTLASSEKVLQKVYDTKRKNGTLTTSKPEVLIYNKLKSKFQDIIHIYRDKNRYPYNCDFYIPSKDLFIELNFHWTHGKEPFNANNQKHLEKLNLWKKRAEKSKFYQTAIDVWTKRDPQKMHTACINRLLYYTFYTEEQFNMWYNNI